MRIVQILAVISFLVMWCSTVVLADGIEKATEGNKVGYEQIYISLPVYIVSLLATAGFVWTASKYDNKRLMEIKGLREQIQEMAKTMCRFPAGCDTCEHKDGCKIYELQNKKDF